MAVLSSAVIAAGVRAGQFVRYYETVAQLLATTDSLAVGEIIRTPKYEYECVSTGEHLTTAGGAKLKCLASPYVTPDQFGAPGQGNDETAYVEAAIASGMPVFLNRFYDVTNVQFPANVDGITILGAGPTVSGLKGTDANSEAILQTFEPGSTADSIGHNCANFSVIGYGKRGVAVCQVINSNFEMVHTTGGTGQSPNTFVGGVAFVLECTFGCGFKNIQMGSGATKCDFQVNATVLDTMVDMLYTNNANVQHHIDINQERKEIAEQQAAGHGVITFNTATLQGARGYAVKIGGTYSAKFHNMYFENVVGAIMVLDCDHLYIDGSEITSNSAGHAVWIDQSKGGATYNVEFVGCTIERPIVMGAARKLNLIGCSGTYGGIGSVLFTNASTMTQEATPTQGGNRAEITSIGDYGAKIGLKCSDGTKHTRISVTEAGVISAETAFNLGIVDHQPHSPVCAAYSSSVISWTSGVAITPITCRAAGGDGSYTFSIVGDKHLGGALPAGVAIDSGTGTVSGTPSETGTFGFRIRVTDGNGMVDEGRTIYATVS